MGNSSNRSLGHCFDEKDSGIIVISRTSVAGFSLAVSVLVLIFAIAVSCKRKKYDINVNMMLYLLVPSNLYLVAVIAQIITIYTPYFDPQGFAIGCQFLSVFTLYFDWMLMMTTCCIVIQLLIFYLFQPSRLRQNTLETQKLLRKIEFCYILSVLVIPLLFLPWPFITNQYGQDGTWCFIKTFNDTNCGISINGIVEDISLWYIWKLCLMIFMLFSLILIVCLKWKILVGKKKKRRILMAYLVYLTLHLLLVCIDIIIIILKLYRSGVTDYTFLFAIEMIYSMLGPCQSLVASAVVLVYFCQDLGRKCFKKEGEKLPLINSAK
jgi:hypothetical protein